MSPAIDRGTTATARRPRHEGLTRVSDWMRSLAGHYVNSRIAHPEDDLLVVFDIDGTILDMGH